MKKYNLENSLDQFESLSEIEAMEQVNGGRPIKPTPIDGPSTGPGGRPIPVEPEPPMLLFYGVYPRFDLDERE